MMLPPVLLVAALVSSPPAGFAPTPTAALQTPDAKKQDPLEVLQNEYRQWAAEAARSKDGVPGRTQFVDRATALMKSDPRSSLAVRTRVWAVVANLDPRRTEEWLDELLTQDIASPDLVELCEAMRPNSRLAARATMETLAEKAGDRTVRGRALRALADHVKAELDAVRALETLQLDRAAVEKTLGRDRADAAVKAGVEGLTTQYVALLERVAKDYADVKDARGRAIGPRAEGALFELQRLQIGMIAPDIEAEDIDGTTFKLSDYRGKVVVLDFWGHW